MRRSGTWLLATIGLGAAVIAKPESRSCTVTVGYRTTEIAGRVVALWYPTDAQPRHYAYSANFSSVLAPDGPVRKACDARVPLVVFSHGDLGCGLQSVTFTEGLARHGYIVAAPDHADAALCHTVAPPQGATRPPQPEQPPILRPEDWSEDSRRDRRADIEAILDTLLADAEFAPVIDSGRIGLAGHSLGGYTVVGLAGGWPSWRDRRVRAVLALSPYVMPFQVRKTLGGVAVPLMYQGGTLDIGITPFLEGPQGAFADARSPAYLLVLKQAGHFAWVNCGHEHTTQSCLEHATNARLIAAYGIAFFDRHLKGRAAPILDGPNAEIAEWLVK